MSVTDQYNLKAWRIVISFWNHLSLNGRILFLSSIPEPNATDKTVYLEHEQFLVSHVVQLHLKCSP